MDRETVDVPSFISYTSQSISTLSWAVAMYTTMSHINCLISALTSPAWAQISNMRYNNIV